MGGKSTETIYFEVDGIPNNNPYYKLSPKDLFLAEEYLDNLGLNLEDFSEAGLAVFEGIYVGDQDNKTPLPWELEIKIRENTYNFKICIKDRNSKYVEKVFNTCQKFINYLIRSQGLRECSLDLI